MPLLPSACRTLAAAPVWTGVAVGLAVAAAGTLAAAGGSVRPAALAEAQQSVPVLWLLDALPLLFVGVAVALRRWLVAEARLGGRMGALTAALVVLASAAFGYAVHERTTALRHIGYVNEAGSLRYRSLYIPTLIAEGRPWRAELGAMEAVVTRVLGGYPTARPDVGVAWVRYRGALLATGAVSFETTEAMRLAADRLTGRVEASGVRHTRQATVGFAAGMLALAVALGASLRLLVQVGRMQHALGASEARFRATLAHAPIGMATVGLDGRFGSVNRVLADLLGRTEADVLALRFHDVTHPDDLATGAGHLRDLLAGTAAAVRAEKRYRRPDGSDVWAQLDLSLVRDADGAPLHFIAQIQDVTARRDAQSRLRHLASHDALTGLPQRAALAERIDRAIARRGASAEHSYAVLFLDLDRFKPVNDTYGHAVGDALLVAVADRIRACLRPADLAARVGGDEFAVLLDGMVTEETAAGIAERIRDAVAAPFDVGGQAGLRVGASIGVAVGGRAYRTADEVLHDADGAMYRSKSAGRDRLAVCRPAQAHAALAAPLAA